jgi:hypothetical protein
MLSPNACKKTCIAEKNWATALNPLTKVTAGGGEGKGRQNNNGSEREANMKNPDP